MPRFIAADVRDRAVLKVLFLFRKGLRPVGNFTAPLDDALPGRPGAIGCVDFGVRSRLRLMILQVPIRGDERLPDTIEVGMTVRHARRSVRRKLSRGGDLLSCGRHPGQEQEGKNGGRAKPVTHGCSSELHFGRPSVYTGFACPWLPSGALPGWGGRLTDPNPAACRT